MELWDLYDRNGNLTGEVWERRHGNYMNIPEGRYHLVSDILVQHRDGSFLLTKRHIYIPAIGKRVRAAQHSSAKIPRIALSASCLKKQAFCAIVSSLSKSHSAIAAQA